MKTIFAQNQDEDMLNFLLNNEIEKKKSQTKSVPPNPNPKNIVNARMEQMEQKISNLEMLNEIGTIKIFKDFTFPIEIESLKAF